MNHNALLFIEKFGNCTSFNMPGRDAYFWCEYCIYVYSVEKITLKKKSHAYFQKKCIFFSDAEDSRKFKRDMVSGLVSFPRIGRGENAWKFGEPTHISRPGQIVSECNTCFIQVLQRWRDSHWYPFPGRASETHRTRRLPETNQKSSGSDRRDGTSQIYGRPSTQEVTLVADSANRRHSNIFFYPTDFPLLFLKAGKDIYALEAGEGTG